MNISEEIRKGVEALFPEGSLVELRIPKSSVGTIIGFFRDREKLVQAIEEYSGKVPAVYYTLNTPPPELYDNAQTKDSAVVGVHGCKDDEVMVRNWLLIDCDPIRVDTEGKPLADQKVSSTDTEKAASLDTLQNINVYLHEKGWPSPVSADSGNGYHLLYNLGGMPSTKELTETVHKALEHLAGKFNSDKVGVDVVVSNPSRITKAYGSLSMKGEATLDRPHRFSSIRKAGGQEAVTIMQLAALKPTPVVAKKSSIVIKAKAAEKYATTDAPERMEEFLEWYDIAHKVMIREKSAYKWQILPCPFNADHNLGEVAVFVNDDGHYGFKCFHNSCAGNHWQEFKNHLESISGKKFFWQTNATSAAQPDAKPTTKMIVKRASSIAPQVINWLWPNRIPFGKLTMFVGNPEIGKGMATMYIAARATRGDGWHDCKNLNSPSEVIIMSSEDTAGDTIIPRLMAQDADLDKVHIICGVMSEKGEKEFSVDTDLPALRELLEANPDVKVVIIDPIMNHLGSLKGNSEQDVRTGLTPLAKLAEKHGVAIIIVTHFNKNSSNDSIHRVGGAMAMVGVVRIAWTFAEDKEDGKRKMLPLKANIAPNVGGFEYKIIPQEVFHNGQYVSEGKIDWGEKTCSSVDSAIKFKSKDEKPPLYQLAMIWLQEHLEDGEPHSAAEIFISAEYAGFKEDTLEMAVSKLGTIKKSHQEVPGPWLWQIPKLKKVTE
jgi:putative DNA primase/helicase